MEAVDDSAACRRFRTLVYKSKPMTRIEVTLGV